MTGKKNEAPRRGASPVERPRFSASRSRRLVEIEIHVARAARRARLDAVRVGVLDIEVVRYARYQVCDVRLLRTADLQLECQRRRGLPQRGIVRLRKIAWRRRDRRKPRVPGI